VGKSCTAAALALKTVLLSPSLVLMVAPALRQSAEGFRKVLDLYRGLGSPVQATGVSALRLELMNGSRIVCLPGSERTTRGFSPNLIVCDEAARVPDDMFVALRPMLAVSKGRMVCLSSAHAKQGWFFEQWTGNETWDRVCIPADQCPRISKEFLEEERRILGSHFYQMEYECVFQASVDSLFDPDDIMAMVDNELDAYVLE
jgi:hypothetical protein